MKILVDVQALQGHARHRGLGRYSLALAHAMSQIPEVTSLDVLLNAGTDPETIMEARKVVAARMPSARIHVFDAPWPWKSGLSLDVSAHARAERVRELAIRELDPDVLLISSLFELPFTSVLSVPEQRRPFTVVVAYDLLPFTDPLCAFPDEWSPIFSRRFEALKAADLLLAISDYTASELRRCLGPQCPPVRTIWGAPGELGELATVARPAFGDRDGIVCAGGGGGRKNEESSLAAYAQLPPEVREKHRLIIQGYRQPEESAGLVAVAQRLGLTPGEFELLDARLTEQELEDLFAHACVVTMPSLAEGLGLPVLEAWSVGTPAVASGTTSLGEVIADSRWTYNPIDPADQAQALLPLLTDESAWTAAAEHGVGRSTEFTWPRTATLAVSAISDALDAGVPPPGEQLRPTLFILAADGARAEIATGGGHLPVAELLDHLYEVHPITAEELSRSLVADARLLVVLEDTPDCGSLLALPVLADAVLLAGAAILDSALEAAGGFGGLDLLQLTYVEHGARGLRSGLDLGKEVFRSGLGVIAASERVGGELAAGSNALPIGSLLTPVAGWSRSQLAREMADFIESSWRKRAFAENDVAAGDLGYVARNRGSRPGGTIFHDITAPLKVPTRSGIQRVSAALEAGLIPLTTRRVMPVAMSAGALRAEAALLGEFARVSRERVPTLPDAREVHARRGDVLLVTELYDNADEWIPVVGEWRARGGSYVQVIYDLLPIQYEDFFVAARPWFERFVRMVCLHADLVVCDSRSVAQELSTWLSENPVERSDGRVGPEITFMRLGYDLSHTVGFPVGLRTRPRGRRNVLVVGTIEPRKGVEVVLDAAEGLWRRGEDIQFTFVGNRGWAPPSTLDRLEQMTQSERPVHWIQGADDEQLRLEYLNADLLVMASRGEGFGLPIVEALAHGVPVVARDLPVFRELLGDDGDYFRLDRELPEAILARLRSDAPIAHVPDRLVTWQETAKDLLDAIDRHTAGRV